MRRPCMCLVAPPPTMLSPAARTGRSFAVEAEATGNTIHSCCVWNANAFDSNHLKGVQQVIGNLYTDCPIHYTHPYHTRNLRGQRCYYTRQAKIFGAYTHPAPTDCAVEGLQGEFLAACIQFSSVATTAGPATQRPGGVLKRLKENKKAARFHKQPSPWSVENRSWILTALFTLVPPPVDPRP